VTLPKFAHFPGKKGSEKMDRRDQELLDKQLTHVALKRSDMQIRAQGRCTVRKSVPAYFCVTV
jgi:hypothetical protein